MIGEGILEERIGPRCGHGGRSAEDKAFRINESAAGRRRKIARRK